jgi:hypothetical protein
MLRWVIQVLSETGTVPETQKNMTNPLNFLVEERGFEPPTFWFQIKESYFCYICLSHYLNLAVLTGEGIITCSNF